MVSYQDLVAILGRGWC